MAPSALFRLGLFMFLIHISHADLDSPCPTTNTSLINFTSHFTMVQHQLRGILTVLDDCSFRVSQFDMLSGSDVHWWGAPGIDLKNLTSGFLLSDSGLNRTYKNDTFIVRLRKNVTWDHIRVLVAWDIPTASNFGHILLGNHSVDGGVNLVEGKPPTVLENCKVLSDHYRIRWSLNEGENAIDIGLEAAVATQDYMGFGWANPSASGSLMVGGDVVITGFAEDGMPFAQDFYITRTSECMIGDDGSFQGVCPDSLYNDKDSLNSVNNSKLIYGHRKDGVSFIRYRRPLQSDDSKYDLHVRPSESMTVIWAIGPIKPPDSLRPFYLPQNHGGSFGHMKLNVSDRVNDCLGPLDAQDKEDQDLIIADKKEPLIISTGSAMHYPNPPNPFKVLYINKKEAPVLRVERGVQVKFSIQAGHDVALYVTSDPIGGNATLRNMSETIYFGGPDAQGVQAKPTELVWAPDRNTPDIVYYQSLYIPKMGWKIQVVDGGLPDMYNNSVSLDDQQVNLFWSLSHRDSSISIAARGEKKSGYLAIGFGRGMVNSYVYVGWIDDTGMGRVNTYWITGTDSSNVQRTKENLTYVRCKSENGIITLEFTRPLNPSCDRIKRPECNNIIDPSTPLKVIWAMGAQWSDEHLSVRNMHFTTSKRPMSVLLMRGSAEAEEDLRPVLAVHGFMMFLAWGILLPGGILAARYMKHVKDDNWFRIHVYLQYSGLAIVFLGFLFAVAELQGLTFGSLHVKFGMSAILLAVAQPANAYFRPRRPATGEVMSSKRLIWEYTHVIIGRSAIFVGAGALISGMKHLGEKYADENAHGLSWALIVWFLMGALGTMYLEYREIKRRQGRIFGRSNWVLGNGGEEEHLDLLSPNGSRLGEKESQHTPERMEVQLEPLGGSR